MVTATPQPALSVRDTAVCDGHDAIITAVPNIAGGTWTWNPIGATTQSVTVSPPYTATYTVTYRVPRCGVAIDSETVIVNAIPTVALTPYDISCYGYRNGYITASISPPGAYQYLWSDGSTEAIDSGLMAGSYSLQITDTNGCTASAAAAAINEPAQAYAEILPADTLYCREMMCSFYRHSRGIPHLVSQGYIWSPALGLSCTDCPAPLLSTANATDTLNIYTLTIQYNNGCMAVANDTIHVQTAIAAGDAFTPNGDGKNDVFYILARGVDDYHLTIYNRWGEVVFEAADPATGWDGTYKGQAQPSEIYSYYLSIKFRNGQQTQKTGTVTLIR